ncbi:MAG: hypothetical protein HY000_19065, partial [Planctomycetes bacterium]|nr:hypothetical protein [Planctomycetota bacterium]
KPGPNMDGRPRGERFKDIAADLKAMAGGATRPEGAPSPAPTSSPAPAPEPPKVNVPLAKSDNERARGLVDLDRKFVVDPAAMPPAAGSYFRRRPFLSSEVCRKWRCGYLPRDVGGEDRSGGTMRGRVVYPYLAEDGELLTWFGRDPEYEEKHAKWEAGGKTEREPIKTAFVKGFHKGIELFGQHVLRQEGVKDKLQGLGLVVVEGPNEVIRFDTLGLPVVGLCGNRISEEQAEKVARFAREVGGGTVTLMLDLDEEGRKGLLQCMEHLAQRVPVRVGWSSRMYGGKFKGRQPESLTAEEWTEIREYLIRGQVKV